MKAYPLADPRKTELIYPSDAERLYEFAKSVGLDTLSIWAIRSGQRWPPGVDRFNNRPESSRAPRTSSAIDRRCRSGSSSCSSDAPEVPSEGEPAA
jgi:hypothetical protein